MHRDKGYSKPEERRCRWTPIRGIIKALWQGPVVATIFAIVFIPVVIYAPMILFNGLLRAFIAFGLAWMMFGIVQDAAGMTGWFSSAWAIVLTLGVFLSHHLVAALTGVEIVGSDGPPLAGAEWLNLGWIVVVNLVSLIGIGAAAMICHTGAPGGSVGGDILSMRLWWGSWG